MSRLDTTTFVERARIVHGSKYDYSVTTYVRSGDKLEIRCPEHGVFLQLPHNHINGSGCPCCNGGVAKTNEQFCNKSKLLFGDQFDYSKTEYASESKKVILECKEHGEFLVTPKHHLNKGGGCPDCSAISYRNRRGRDYDQFITDSHNAHGDYYLYPIWDGYKNKGDRITINCPEHGDFTQTIQNHIAGRGCIVCGYSRAGGAGGYNWASLDRGTFSDLQGQVYLVRLSTGAFKVGISKDGNLKVRMYSYSKFNPEIVFQSDLMPLVECFELEQLVLDCCDRLKHEGAFSGATECFHSHALDVYMNC